MMIRCALLSGLICSILNTVFAADSNGDSAIRWASQYDLTYDRYQMFFQKNVESGYMQIDVEAYPCGDEIRYAMVWRENVEGRDWQSRINMTEQEFTDLRNKYEGELGYRLFDLEIYIDDYALPVFAAIWVGNNEGFSWDARYGLTRGEYEEYFDQQTALGRRLIDFEAYVASDGVRYAAIWYDNPVSTNWLHAYDLTRTEYEQLAAERNAEYRIIDFESYQTTAEDLYAAVWEARPENRRYSIEYDLDEREFEALWYRYRDSGFRHIKFEWYDTRQGPRYSGIWLADGLGVGGGPFFEPDDTLWVRIDTTIAGHRIRNGIPGVSVAVIYQGEMLYLGGQGMARTFGNPPVLIPAHGETVYLTASISKLIGSTLAAMLEAEGMLNNGASVDLDLSQNTSYYLPGIPDHHTHTVEQLLAHLGCIGHYNDTQPPIPNQTDHYSSAMQAVQSIWDIPLVYDCTVGIGVDTGKLYSTAGFTFVDAILEQATGRTIQRLIEEEIAGKFDLPSIRAQWGTRVLTYGDHSWTFGFLPPNYERATRYNEQGEKLDEMKNNNSWKVSGGGIEMNVKDLARFGWMVLNGEIVSPDVRDNRLWVPVADDCEPFTGSSWEDPCMHGLGWALKTRSGRRIAHHGGSWDGARGHINVYPDEELVVAVLTNMKGHNPETLTLRLANIVFDHVGGIEKPIASDPARTVDEDTAPSRYRLDQNYPNPFNPTTTIRFALPDRQHVSLKVYDMLGRETATLVDEILHAGEHSVIFNAHDLSSGVYIYRIQSNGNINTRRMILLK